ncbi:MAG: aldo/keto reductase [bacterium]|nr:aldo/keto reductase [bacterium]
MKLRQLGTTDLYVSPVIFGAWAIGGWYWGGTDDSQAIRAIHAALDEGINCIDTAPVYGFGHSEEIVGRAIRDRRNHVILATKCGLRWDLEQGESYFKTTYAGVSYSVFRNLRKASIILECERSLKRLNTDVIDLYQCHWPDKTTPLDETMDAMLSLRQQGKIRAIGVSNFTAAMMEECLRYVPLASDQPEYNLLNRDIERDIVPFCIKHNIALIVYKPIMQGLLTGKVTIDRLFPSDDFRGHNRWFKPENRARVLAALESLKNLAEAHHATLAQLVIAWTIRQPGITAAIVGARNPEQVHENARAADLLLSDQEDHLIRTTFDTVLESPQQTT